ncbi:hypothetical protein V6R98_20385 [Agrobacterium sp. CCNWLW71]|uniref:hypothetical protein n=1 Tax=unclassified Agrobacterium TaxID=2632611 RepID=UPI002FF42CF8
MVGISLFPEFSVISENIDNAKKDRRQITFLTCVKMCKWAETTSVKMLVGAARAKYAAVVLGLYDRLGVCSGSSPSLRHSGLELE